MANNIAEQFEEFYSRWSMLDKVGNESQLATMMSKAQGLYQYLVMTYGHKGYLTIEEYNQVEQIKQFYQYLQAQKMQVDQDLWNEIMKQLAKMIVRR